MMQTPLILTLAALAAAGPEARSLPGKAAVSSVPALQSRSALLGPAHGAAVSGSALRTTPNNVLLSATRLPVVGDVGSSAREEVAQASSDASVSAESIDEQLSWSAPPLESMPLRSREVYAKAEAMIKSLVAAPRDAALQTAGRDLVSVVALQHRYEPAQHLVVDRLSEALTVSADSPQAERAADGLARLADVTDHRGVRLRAVNGLLSGLLAAREFPARQRLLADKIAALHRALFDPRLEQLIERRLRDGEAGPQAERLLVQIDQGRRLVADVRREETRRLDSMRRLLGPERPAAFTTPVPAFDPGAALKKAAVALAALLSLSGAAQAGAGAEALEWATVFAPLALFLSSPFLVIAGIKAFSARLSKTTSWPAWLGLLAARAALGAVAGAVGVFLLNAMLGGLTDLAVQPPLYMRMSGELDVPVPPFLWGLGALAGTAIGLAWERLRERS